MRVAVVSVSGVVLVGGTYLVLGAGLAWAQLRYRVAVLGVAWATALWFASAGFHHDPEPRRATTAVTALVEVSPAELGEPNGKGRRLALEPIAEDAVVDPAVVVKLTGSVPTDPKLVTFVVAGRLPTGATPGSDVLLLFAPDADHPNSAAPASLDALLVGTEGSPPDPVVVSVLVSRTAAPSVASMLADGDVVVARGQT